jgi:hypothetical protein
MGQSYDRLMAKLFGGIALVAGMVVAATAAAAELRTKGKLDVPAGAALTVVSTDPIVQRVLSEDIAAARRTAALEGKVLTLTVTLNQQTLRPGVSLADISPGDPEVAALLKAAGAKAPALADTGSSRTDPYAAVAGAQARNATETAAQQIDRMSGYSQLPGFFSQYDPKKYLPSRTGDAGELYDSAIVARTVLSEGRGELAVVAVVHPGEDAREIRKLIAEKIANALLH